MDRLAGTHQVLGIIVRHGAPRSQPVDGSRR